MLDSDSIVLEKFNFVHEKSLKSPWISFLKKCGNHAPPEFQDLLGCHEIFELPSGTRDLGLTSHSKDWSTWRGNEICWHMLPLPGIELGNRESHRSWEAPVVSRSNQLSYQGPTLAWKWPDWWPGKPAGSLQHHVQSKSPQYLTRHPCCDVSYWCCIVLGVNKP